MFPSLGLTAAFPAAATALDLGLALPAWSALPFAGLLLSIALGPLVAPHWWHHHYPKVALVWGLAFVVPFVLAFGQKAALGELFHVALLEYIPFVILLAALFVIGGGILVRGTLVGRPSTNITLIAIGTVIASLIGTTGASMVLIRPLLRANRTRKHRVHTVVFFIFLVSNIGGSLTPLGDPPLFLGFLQGVPFFWTLSLTAEFLVVAALVLGAYSAIEIWFYRREVRLHPERFEPSTAPHEPIRIEGWLNAALLCGVLAAVVLSGFVRLGSVDLWGVHAEIQNLVRDVVLLALLWISWRKTPTAIREGNQFGWGPIREVAILFAAIFATIIPALAILKAGEAGAFASFIRSVQTPAQFFWATGILSSFLDNAPTYLAFLSTALGRFYAGVPQAEAIQRLIAENGDYLKAIATGAVFMGANTYIGNAPNFMVRSIAEEAGVEMPSFFGYLFRYSLPVLVPVFLIATWIFF